MLVRFLACVSLVVLLIPATFVRDGPRVANTSQDIGFHRTAFLPEGPTSRRIGALELRDAWEMTSANDLFYGLSALAPRPGGGLLGVSDAGVLMGFTPPGEVESANSFIAPLPSITGRELSKSDRDSESVTFDPVSGRYWIGFEYAQAIARFGPSFARMEGQVRPRMMRHWPGNAGPESLVRLTDGRFIVIAEGASAPGGGMQAVLFDSDPIDEGPAMRFAWAPPDGYRPTDAALLPNGCVAILHRALSIFRGFSAKLVIADPARIRRGRIWSGRTIATLAAPMAIDNMEGLAVTAAPDGGAVLWMVSDDNNSSIQRTVLLKFGISDAGMDCMEKGPKAPASEP